MGSRAGVAAVAAVLAVLSTAPAGAQSNDPAPIVIRGTGAAHGFGLAMDGVEAQARNGWSHTRILDLFYDGSQTGDASGTIRVGLTSGTSQELGLPGGGEVNDRPFSQGSGPGYPRSVQPGGRVRIDGADAGLVAEVDAPQPAASVAALGDGPTARPFQAQEDLVPDLDLDPTPAPSPATSDPPAPPSDAAYRPTSLWIRPAGDPAVTKLAATGRRYRGVMEVRRIGSSATRVVNHVDLETYVMGIAEEKGQGWPMEAQKVLAIAARTLGAATMTWYSKHHAEGFDICPSGNCQVYLGYDGEEPALRRAVAETKGQIRTYNGMALMAMYHGNGGGHTETYARVADGGGMPHPYLKGVKYPFADPSHWERTTTLTEIASAMAAHNVRVPRPLQLVKVAERGDSPRVLRVRLAGGKDDSELVRGTTFATALGLRSTWFDIEMPSKATPAGEEASTAIEAAATDLPGPLQLSAPATANTSSPWRPLGFASAALCLILAGAVLYGPITRIKPALDRRRSRA